MQFAAEDYDLTPPPLTDGEAREIASQAFTFARLRRLGRRCVVEVDDVIGIGATWEQAIDRALAGLGR